MSPYFLAPKLEFTGTGRRAAVGSNLDSEGFDPIGLVPKHRVVQVLTGFGTVGPFTASG